MPELKRDPSRCVRIGYVGGQTLIFLRGGGQASDPGPLLVIGFHDGDQPFKVLELPAFDLYGFDTTGTVKLVGKPTMSQVFAGEGRGKLPYALTYDPYAVYTYASDKAATYSPAESRAYNEQYYVWAGPRSREDYAVIYNAKGRKRFGVPATEVSHYVK